MVENLSIVIRGFYLRKLYILKNSINIFDKEKSIQDDVQDFPLTENGMPMQNHEFVKSDDSEAVQLPDVIVGFFGKYFPYLKGVNDE